MSDDDLKKTILARRAKFIAAALASSGLGANACDRGSPAVCLSPVRTETTTTAPAVCLSAVAHPPLADAGAADDATRPLDHAADASRPRVCLTPMWTPPAGAGADAAQPQPCLKIQTRPTPCLSVVPLGDPER